jgi:hypothetical protein
MPLRSSANVGFIARTPNPGYCASNKLEAILIAFPAVTCPQLGVNNS